MRLLSASLFPLLLLSLSSFSSARSQLHFASADASSPTFAWSGTGWDHLGPFPIGSREGPLLPPLSPDRSKKSHPSPLADGGYVEWGTASSDIDGWVTVGDAPERVRWDALRRTAGWSVLQHERTYNRRLVIHRSSTYNFELVSGAEFSLARLGDDDDEESSREWFAGNIYSLPTPTHHLVPLEEGTYDVTVTFTYDIRVFGDPGEGSVPKGKWKLALEERSGVRLGGEGSVQPSSVNGWLMGTAVGVLLENPTSDEVEVREVRGSAEGLTATLPLPVKIGPYQSKIVHIELNQSAPLGRFTGDGPSLDLTFGFADATSLSHTLTFAAASSHPGIAFLSTFLSNTLTPTYAMYTSPIGSLSTCSPHALLALHGAGVDPISPFWTNSIPAREREWIVWPKGLTEWGHDWHGASMRDTLLALDALPSVQALWSRAQGSAPIERCERVEKVIVLGHSNGGQGTWHLMAHYPDLVLGGVPASGYVKIQDYTPYHFSRGWHYRDPALTGILSAGLSSFDNDLVTSNLVGIPILNRHGADDDNVPVQHSRQMVSLVESWANASETPSKVAYSEVPGEGHWFDSVLNAPEVTEFVDDLLSQKESGVQDTLEFTLTSVNPDESGPKHGFRIAELDVPGRIARVDIKVWDDPSIAKEGAVLEMNARNARNVEVNLGLVERLVGKKIAKIRLRLNAAELIDVPESLAGSIIYINTSRSGSDSLSTQFTFDAVRRYGPLISILSSPTPIALIIPRASHPRHTHYRSIASRIAADGLVYARLTFDILTDDDPTLVDRRGNVVLLGGSENAVAKAWVTQWPTPVKFIAEDAFQVGQSLFDSLGQGLLFLTPNPNDAKGLALVLTGNGHAGRESAARLFPLRTGVPSADWVVSSSRETDGGIVAAGFWGPDWELNEKISYL